MVKHFFVDKQQRFMWYIFIEQAFIVDFSG